ncbi:MAG: hypothetical protein QMD85_01070 [Candidatus Aenigmarchaeota archaeon]|nr:hypothetical protein [Candidatus Aenigmarchaeota archaeon]
MINLAYDKLPLSSMKEFDSFRERFNFLYLCRSCARSFDSTEPRSDCKFCSSEGLEVLDMKVRGKVMYRYFCPSCEKNRLTKEHVGSCAGCGSRFIHLYKWDRKGRKEMTRMRARDLLEKTKKKAFSLRSGLKDAVKREEE